MVTREISLGYADISQVEQVLTDLLSPGSQHVLLRSRRVVRITDFPSNLSAVETFIQAMSTAPKNVRVELIARSMSNEPQRGGQISGFVQGGNGRTFGGATSPNTPGVIRQSTVNGQPVPVRTNQGRIVMPGRGAVEVDLFNQNSGSSTLNRSFILVRAGSEGYLEVVRDIPMVDYFTRFTVGTSGFVLQGPGNVRQVFPWQLGGGTFEVPEIRWEKAGTRLVVRPVVQGDLITLDLYPQISAVVFANPEKLRQREINTYLTGLDQYVTYTRLKTTVTVKSGSEITIGGFSNAPAEFNRYFFGANQAGAGSAGSLTLKATLQ